MKKISLLFTFFLSITLWAAPASTSPIKLYHSQKGVNEYLLAYPVKSKWALEIFQQNEGALQNRVVEKFFNTKAHLLNHIEKNYSHFSPSKKKLAFKGVSTELIGRKIWEIKNNWNADWEQKYAAWIRENLTTTFLEENKIATDCADVAVVLRWIFARINFLPMANTLSGSGVLFSNESFKKEWGGLSKAPTWQQDALFIKALNYVADNSYTHSVVADSYPVKISADSLLPGVFHIALTYESGHTRMIGRVFLDSDTEVPIQFFESTVPREVRALSHTMFLDGQSVPSVSEGGFIQFRWAEKKDGKMVLRKSTSMPNYSLEQYTPEFMEGETNFALAIYKRIAPLFNPEVAIEKGLEDIKEQIKRRIEIVREGYRICQKEDCSPGTANWENWSTPSRDARILEKYYEIETLVSLFDNYDLWRKLLEEAIFDIEGISRSLSLIITFRQIEIDSSDPRVSIGQRWALYPADVAQNLETEILPIHQKRKLLIEKQEQVGACTQKRCLPLDKLWNDYNSFELDGQITNVPGRIAQYCSYVEETACNELTKEMKNLFVEGVRLDDYIKNAIWFISDPNYAHNLRWGKQAQSLRHKVLPTQLSSLFVSKYGFAIYDGITFSNLPSGESVENIEGTQELIPYLESPFIIASVNGAEKGVYCRRYDEHFWSRLTEKEALARVIRISKNHLAFIDAENTIKIYQFDENCKNLRLLKLISEVEYIEKMDAPASSYSDLLVLKRLTDQQKIIVEIVNNELIITPILLPEDNLELEFIFNIHQNYTIIYYSGSSAEDGDFKRISRFIEKKSGRELSIAGKDFSSIFLEKKFPSSGLILGHLSEDGESYSDLLFQIDSTMNVSIFLECPNGEINDWLEKNGRQFFSCHRYDEIDDIEQSAAYEFKSRKMIPFNLLDGFKIISSMGDKLLIEKKQDKSRYISDFDQHHLVKISTNSFLSRASVQKSYQPKIGIDLFSSNYEDYSGDNWINFSLLFLVNDLFLQEQTDNPLASGSIYFNPYFSSGDDVSSDIEINDDIVLNPLPEPMPGPMPVPIPVPLPMRRKNDLNISGPQSYVERGAIVVI